MAIYLGNLTLKEFERRTNVKLNDEDYKIIDNYRTESANSISKNQLHIFDMPFMIVCGSEVFEEVLAILRKYDFSKSERFGIGYE